VCGRYQRKPGKQKIAEQFRVRHAVEHIAMPPEDLNITPFSTQPVIRENRDDGQREMALMQWSMVPFHTKDPKTLKGRNMFNARAESIATTGAWREPFKKRRCLVPASGFYEWDKLTGTKKPYTFSLTDGSLFAFAGIWDAWKDPRGDWLQSFAVITTEPNELMGRIHPRMPVILHCRDYDRWLSREETERLPLDLLRPFESEGMDMVEGGPPIPNTGRKGPMAFHATTTLSGELF
jgi:putative SOS response-associated peptidase YedK